MHILVQSACDRRGLFFSGFPRAREWCMVCAPSPGP